MECDWPETGESWTADSGRQDGAGSSVADSLWGTSNRQLANSVTDETLAIDGATSNAETLPVDGDTVAASIRVEVRDGVGYVWSADDALRLRTELGVCGQTAGCLARAPRQNMRLGLPVMLMPEEIALLGKMVACRLVSYPELCGPRSETHAAQLERHEAVSVEEQQRHLSAARRKQLLDQANRIVDGKWELLQNGGSRKRKAKKRPRTQVVPTGVEDGADSMTRDRLRFEFIERLTSDIRPPPAEQCYRQLYRQCPVRTEAVQLSGEQLPLTRLQRLRAASYADLWSRGYVLTDGLKFGCDFLAYEGDPLLYHAVFLVVCRLDGRLTVLEAAALQRLAHGCGKTLLVYRWRAGADDIDGVVHQVYSRTDVKLMPYIRTVN